LFPGYLFCRLEGRNWLPVLKTPGVLHLVGFGRRPVPVSEREITAIQRIVQGAIPARPHEFLEIEQPIRISHGPLAGLEGRVVKLHDQCRLVVSVTLLRRSVSVELNRDWILPLRPLPIRKEELSRAVLTQRPVV
jgi:transcription antitermination factor NusG